MGKLAVSWNMNLIHWKADLMKSLFMVQKLRTTEYWAFLSMVRSQMWNLMDAVLQSLESLIQELSNLEIISRQMERYA